MKRAIFPGTFDPLHLGHKKVISKALKLFDQVFVLVSINPEKEHASDLATRFKKVQVELASFGPRVIVMQNALLMTADWARAHGIDFLIRSARNNDDFQYELELAAGNHALNPNLETILIIPNYEDINYHSRLLKQQGGKV